VQAKSAIYRQTDGSVAELTDLLDGQAAGLGYSQAIRVLDQVGGRVLVDRTILDLFAAELHAAVEAGKADRYLYDHFVEFLGGEAGRFLGDNHPTE
jgi:hypothetical protein